MIKGFSPVIFASLFVLLCAQSSFAQKIHDAPQTALPAAQRTKKAPEVIIYSADFCGYCHSAMEIFDRKKVPYKTINVHNNKRLIDEMEQKTGKRTIPQIIINGKHVGGYMSLVGANMTGSLDEMLGLNDHSQTDPK